MSALAVLAVVAYTNTGEVRACLPVDSGFLVGTGGGLVWTDASGTTKRVWTRIDGLPATRIDGLTVVEGAIWVGTEEGIAKISIDRGELHATTKHAGITVRDAIAFGGATYFATDDGVRKGTHAVAFKGGANKQARARVASLAVADGALWAGTAGGLYKLRDGAFELVTVETGANDITSLYGDGATLWIATTNGLFTRTGSTVRGYGGGDMRRVTKLDGAIVAAGLGGGMVTVDRNRLVDYRGPGLRMMLAVTERDGAACAGGIDGLALRASKTTAWKPVARAAMIPANDVSALAADGATLWVGTFDHGLAKYANGRWTQVGDGKLDHRVNALLVEPRAGKASRVWVATASGLSIVDGDRISTLAKRDGLPARGVLSLARMRDGRILAGTMHGAAIIGDGRPMAIGPKQNIEVKNVWAVAEDSQGYLWIGATSGVYRGKPDDSAWTRYSVATGDLRDDWVMALAPHGDAMFVGTYKGGLTRFDLAATVATSQLGEGWINPGGLRWDGDTLYASTMNGLRTTDGKGGWLSSEELTVPDTTATARSGQFTYVATRRGVVARP